MDKHPVRPLISLIELKRTLVRAPDVCDQHVRSRVMELGREDPFYKTRPFLFILIYRVIECGCL